MNYGSNVSIIIPMISENPVLSTLQHISSIPAAIGGLIMIVSLLCAQGEWLLIGLAILLAGIGLMWLTGAV